MVPIANIMVEAEAKQEVEHIVTKEEIHEETVTPDIACSCVRYAHTKRPDIPLIDAEDHVISTTTPFVGAVAKMYYPNSGTWHLAYVEYVDLERGLAIVDDANYEPCKVTRRWITLPYRVVGYL